MMRDVRLMLSSFESMRPSEPRLNHGVSTVVTTLILHYSRYSMYGPSRLAKIWSDVYFSSEEDVKTHVLRLLTFPTDPETPLDRLERDCSKVGRTAHLWGIGENSFLRWYCGQDSFSFYNLAVVLFGTRSSIGTDSEQGTYEVSLVRVFCKKMHKVGREYQFPHAYRATSTVMSELGLTELPTGMYKFFGMKRKKQPV